MNNNINTDNMLGVDAINAHLEVGLCSWLQLK